MEDMKGRKGREGGMKRERSLENMREDRRRRKYNETGDCGKIYKNKNNK